MHRAALFDALVGATRQLVWTTDPQGETHDDSPGWRAFTGQSERAFLGSGWRDAIHPDDRERILHLCDGILGSDRSTYETECRLRHADGHLHTAHVRCVVVRGENGCARELETMLGSMAEGVTAYRADATIAYMNPAGKRLFGLDTDPDFFDRPLSERGRPLNVRNLDGRPLPPDQWPWIRILRGEDLTGSRAVDVLMLNLRGEERVISYSGAPIRDADGAITGALMVYCDVTEQRRLEQRTHNTLEVLLKLAETIVSPPSREDATAGQRLRDIARPPVELARQAIGCDQAGVMTLDPASGAFDVVALVSRTLEMTRFWEEEVRRTPAREYFKPGDFERFLSGEVVVIRMDAPRFKDRYPDVAPTILSAPLYSQGEVIGLVGFAYLREHDTFKPEEIAIARAVARLSGLAIEREQLQHERAEARASEMAQRELVRLRDGQVWVGVRDFGPGLPPEERERVWERFHRAPGIEVAAGSDVGLGIGLYISRTIVEAHGGQVGVECVQGEGSTFWFTLPTNEGPHAETP